VISESGDLLRCFLVNSLLLTAKNIYVPSIRHHARVDARGSTFLTPSQILPSQSSSPTRQTSKLFSIAMLQPKTRLFCFALVLLTLAFGWVLAPYNAVFWGAIFLR
jgi:hypothetical protein